MSPVFRRKLKVPNAINEEEGFIPPHFDAELIKTWRSEKVLQEKQNILYIKNYKGSPLFIELSLFK